MYILITLLTLVAKMNMKRIRPTHCYPDVEIKEWPTSDNPYFHYICLSTYLRIKSDDGFYYRWDVVETLSFKNIEDRSVNMSNAFNRLNRNIYCALTFGKINPDLTFSDGTPIFEKDSDQTDEKERMEILFGVNA